MDNQQLIKLLIELSNRLGDESDYEDHLLPKLVDALNYLEAQS